MIKKDLKSKNVNDEPKEDAEYDDPDGYYMITKGDHLLYRYEIICELGRGSYGQVSKFLKIRELNVLIIGQETRFVSR